MEIELINKDTTKKLEIEEDTAVEDILKQEDIPIETVVSKVNDITVTEDEILKDGDKLEIIKVIYGG